VVNAGSSSVKLRVVEDGTRVSSATDLGAPDAHLADRLDEFAAPVGPVDAVGHRVVHGGSRFLVPVRIGPDVRHGLEGLNDLAPLHNRPALVGIDAAATRFAGVPQVACFDTSFHTSLPPEVTTYAVPADWVSRWGIRRYGFHGLSCAWAARRAPVLLGRPADRLRLVVCHLGAGASVTAVAAGRSADTTMGFTPLEGLVMATRSGDLDPGALLYALGHGLTTPEADHALEYRSGLFGLCEPCGGDMRRLLAARTGGDRSAYLAVTVYLHRLRAKIAAMTAATSGTDALVFTGGVGEGAPAIRSEVVAGLEWMGARLDEDANRSVGGADTEISAAGSAVATLVVHSREELQIADECAQVLASPA